MKYNSKSQRKNILKEAIRNIKYPNCDNCGKPIVTFGKHIPNEGIIMYVHESYDRETGLCQNQSINKLLSRIVKSRTTKDMVK